MRGVIALAIFAMAGTASAQSVPGVRIGMTGAQAQAVIGGRISDLRGRPGSEVLTTDRYTIGLCNGVVFETRAILGTSVHDFAAVAEEETTKRGDGVLSILNDRTAGGEISWIRLNWVDGARQFGVNLLQTPSGTSVSKAETDLTNTC